MPTFLVNITIIVWLFGADKVPNMNEMVPAGKTGYPSLVFFFLLQEAGFGRDENEGKAIRRRMIRIWPKVAGLVQVTDKSSFFVLHVWKKKAGLFPALRWTPGFPLRPSILYINLAKKQYLRQG